MKKSSIICSVEADMADPLTDEGRDRSFGVMSWRWVSFALVNGAPSMTKAGRIRKRILSQISSLSTHYPPQSCVTLITDFSKQPTYIITLAMRLLETSATKIAYKGGFRNSLARR